MEDASSHGAGGGTVLEAAWAALGGPPGALAAVEPGGWPALPSRLAVAELVRDAVAAASLAGALATGDPGRRVLLDADRVATAVTTERHVRVDGVQPDVWADLSGFWPAADGWVRTHANYPHHRRRLLAALGLDDGVARDVVAARVATLAAREVEDRVAAAGGVAAAVRTVQEWRRHPQARAVAAERLVTVRTHPAGATGGLGTGRPGPRTDPPGGAAAPLAGIRVLDLTRVLAGPVATRTLALLGAQVLRVDPRGMAEPEWVHLDTGAGKRSTLLDLREPTDRARLDALLATADVVVTGYRPGALDDFGLAPDALAVRFPGVVVGRVSAWGTTGPWAGRRGFDSIVQAASGIAAVEGGADPDAAAGPDAAADRDAGTDRDAGGASEPGPGPRPGALPAQALDHAAGYLLSAGVTLALLRRASTGAGATVEVALARLAQELLARPVLPEAAAPGSPAAGAPTLTDLQTRAGRLTTALPAVSYRGGPTGWPHPPRPWGRDGADWV